MNLIQQDMAMLRHFFSDRPAKKAYLFGSHARNEASSKSDIDILVEMDYSTPAGLASVQLALDLEAMLHTKVDLVTTDGLPIYVKPFIDKDKRLIYERAA